jgi:hypothetical protein
MDDYLKLKLDVLYRDLSIEEAKKRFDELKQRGEVKLPPEKPKRKLIKNV